MGKYEDLIRVGYDGTALYDIRNVASVFSRFFIVARALSSGVDTEDSAAMGRALFDFGSQTLEAYDVSVALLMCKSVRNASIMEKRELHFRPLSSTMREVFGSLSLRPAGRAGNTLLRIEDIISQVILRGDLATYQRMTGISDEYMTALCQIADMFFFWGALHMPGEVRTEFYVDDDQRVLWIIGPTQDSEIPNVVRILRCLAMLTSAAVMVNAVEHQLGDSISPEAWRGAVIEQAEEVEFELPESTPESDMLLSGIMDVLRDGVEYLPASDQLPTCGRELAAEAWSSIGRITGGVQAQFPIMGCIINDTLHGQAFDVATRSQFFSVTEASAARITIATLNILEYLGIEIGQGTETTA